jgi:superkiller protein 3
MKKTLWVCMAMLFVCSVAAQGNTSVLYNEGLALKKEKKINEALQKFRQVVELDSNHGEAWYESGWCLNDLKQYGTAMDALRKARVLLPRMPKVFFELGYAFQKQNMADSAIKSYHDCLELKPDYANVFKQLAYLYYEKSQYALAMENFIKYEQYAASPSTDYLYWYKKGFTCNALKDYANAKTALQKSESINSGYINTFNELGFCCTKLKQDEEAIEYFKKAMVLDPKSHVPYNGIAEVYRDNKKNMDEAMVWYRKTLDMNPTERKACFGMGYCLNAKEQYADAAGYLKKAIESEPTFVAAYVELGYSYYMLGRMDESLANLNKAMAMNAGNENSRYYACLVYIAKNDKFNAQKMVDELKKLSSKLTDKAQQKVNAM